MPLSCAGQTYPEKTAGRTNTGGFTSTIPSTIRRSDGSDLPGNNVLKAALRDRCGRRASHGIRYLPDRLCAGGGKEEKIRDELLKYNNFKPVQDSFYGCPAFFVAVFAVFLTFIFTGDLYLLPLSNA